MKKSNKLNSTYRYNPLDPRNWNFFVKITVITCLFLLYDWVFRFYVMDSFRSPSYLARVIPNAFFVRIFPLITIIMILSVIPLINREISETQLFGAIIIKTLLYLGSFPFTLIGAISEFILDLYCSFTIVFILVFAILFESEEPVNPVQALLIGVSFFIGNYIFNIFVFGWRIDEIWGLIFILTCLLCNVFIHKEKLIFAFPILIMIVLNEYIFPFELGSFGTGSMLVLVVSLFLIFRFVGERT